LRSGVAGVNLPKPCSQHANLWIVDIGLVRDLLTRDLLRQGRLRFAH
jgi:hypothetical protein